MNRLAGFAASLFLATAACQAQAQAWPTKPVKIIVPFAAGGPADIYARALGEKLQASFGQAFVVEDKPGAGSIVGTDFVAKSPADGYTLLMMSNTHTVNESLVPVRPFQLLRDFVPVAPVNSSDLLLVVHPSVPATTLQEFLALARSKPGTLNYASSGNGTPYHMAGELFKAMAGVDIVHVPYKGSSGARTDVLGGQVQMMFDAITTMAPNVRAGKLKALGTSGKTRSSVLPEVPTVSEAGVPGYEALIWLGVMAPAGTPKPIVEKLNAEIRRIVESPEMREAWMKQGAVPMTMTTEEFARYLREDIDKWARIVKISAPGPTSSMRLRILSAGAAQALVGTAAKDSKTEIAGTFGAVGAIREQLLAGEPCDVLVLTASQIEEFMASGRVVAGTAADLGAVPTSIAVREAEALPDVSTPDALRTALLAADEIYLPDPQRATAGIHFAKVLAELGIAESVASRLKAFPNGATAMREMAQSRGRAIGCTQATEILAATGIALVAPLPEQYRLATVYTASLAANANEPAGARRFIEMLTGDSLRSVRARCGFEGYAIRPARSEDSKAVLEIVFAILREYAIEPDPEGTDRDIQDVGAHYLERGGGFDVVVAADGAVVGSCGIHPEEDGACELRKMYLRHDARGHGLGKRLLARAIAFARGRGFRRMELETASVLKEAISLYEHSGFRPLAGRHRVSRCDRAFVLELGSR